MHLIKFEDWRMHGNLLEIFLSFNLSSTGGHAGLGFTGDENHVYAQCRPQALLPGEGP